MTATADQRRETPLALKLKARLAAQGPISVSDYMAACLWDAEYGYYATRNVIGARGDFITAAEISQVFGEIVGIWAGVVWHDVFASPAHVTLTEYGPGRGTMMRDALRAARVVPGFLDAAHVHLVEMSAVLANTQRENLASAAVPLTWGRNLAGFPTPAIIIANEFLDAWPLEQWVLCDDGWRMRGVMLDMAGDLAFCLLPVAPPAEVAATFPPSALGTILERHDTPRLADALKAIAATGPITALFIDYGYTEASVGDTLQAVRDHTYEHVLTSPGEADLSAHVSFLELARAMHTAGFAIDGPVTQAEFLGSLGAIERAQRLIAANPVKAGMIETGLARLIAPGGMGTRFKVMGVRSPTLRRLPGFSAGAA
ncbi:MAG: class I SAM-dependent methyltransferase [Hyphomicrobium sp.]